MRAARWFIVIVAAAGTCWWFPLFHIVPLKRATEEKLTMVFNATHFAEKFWSDIMLHSLDRAVKTEVLLPAIQKAPAAARAKYSRSLGLSDSYFYFVSGTGRVVAVSADEVSLAMTDGATWPEISIQTGMIFGNTIRDGTGLVNVNDFPNSQDFNDIAAALNHLVETRVLVSLRERAKVGGKIHFTGCAEVTDESTDLKPLKVIPIQVEIQ